jgi:hypothetical protein
MVRTIIIAEMNTLAYKVPVFLTAKPGFFSLTISASPPFTALYVESRPIIFQVLFNATTFFQN